MLSRIKQLFQGSPEVAANPEDAKQRLQLATCVVLLEVARSDDEFCEDERRHIVATMRKRFDLSEDDAHELIEAATAKREESVDLWSFTHQINKGSNIKEKIGIIEEVWRVIFADGTLDGHEDFLIHRLAKLFHLSHAQLIEAKLRIRQELKDDGS